MMARARALAARRAQLRQCIQDQRATLGEQTRVFAPLLIWTDRGVQVLAFVREHPWTGTIPAIVLLALGRRRTARTLSGALVAWRLVRSLLDILKRYRHSA